MSFILESISLATAIHSIKSNASMAKLSVRDYLLYGPDPMNVAVLLEDMAAILGIGIVSSSLGLAYWTGNAVFDLIGSTAISFLLGGVGMFLIHKNKMLLSGNYGVKSKQGEIEESLTKDAVVTSLHDVKIERIGESDFRFKAEVVFDGMEVARKTLETDYDDDFLAKIRKSSDDDFKRWLTSYGDRIVQNLGQEVDRLERKIHSTSPHAKYIDLESHYQPKKKAPPHKRPGE
eukprot:TRINITY_DN10309_c0_g1_i1.p1 TRINITY_DN10309_c0_g1~~TRINITY_DN10309_c0_g1_i1.p1  ORF type:complete len:233 (+),score=33.29 TRINITY_DN10309_c0_g1_i1:391-1089(+)